MINTNYFIKKPSVQLSALVSGLVVLGYLGYRLIKWLFREKTPNNLKTTQSDVIAQNSPWILAKLCTQNERIEAYYLQTRKVDWFSISEKDRLTLLNRLQLSYEESEKSDQPPAGYRLDFRNGFGNEDGLKIVLAKIGTREKGTSMKMPSGIPCCFCDLVSKNTRMKNTEKIGNGRGIRVIQSSRGNPLTIPDQHIPHFFEARPVMQMNILNSAKQAQTIFQDYQDNIHFHIGLEGSQTVPHLHARLV